MAHSQRLEQVATVEPSLAIITVGFSMLQRHLEPWETRSEDDACAVSRVLRNLPVSNQTKTAFPDLFNRSQWNRCVTQSKKSCCHTELSRDVPCQDHFWIDTKFLCKIKGTLDTSKLWHIAKRCGLVHVH